MNRPRVPPEDLVKISFIIQVYNFPVKMQLKVILKIIGQFPLNCVHFLWIILVSKHSFREPAITQREEHWVPGILCFFGIFSPSGSHI